MLLPVRVRPPQLGLFAVAQHSYKQGRAAVLKRGDIYRHLREAIIIRPRMKDQRPETRTDHLYHHLGVRDDLSCGSAADNDLDLAAFPALQFFITEKFDLKPGI